MCHELRGFKNPSDSVARRHRSRYGKTSAANTPPLSVWPGLAEPAHPNCTTAGQAGLGCWHRMLSRPLESVGARAGDRYGRQSATSYVSDSELEVMSPLKTYGTGFVLGSAGIGQKRSAWLWPRPRNTVNPFKKKKKIESRREAKTKAE